MNYTTLIYEKEDPIGIITINRRKQLNAINSVLLQELNTLLDAVEADRNVRVVIITGGEKVFAAGADITELNELKTPADALAFVKLAQGVFCRLENLKKPVIAAVSGIAFGGGCELTLACDIRLASESAQFALPEIKLGILPGAGGSQRLPRIVGLGRAKELLFSGDPIDAHEALHIGLVNKVCPPAELMAKAKQIALMLAQRPGYALETIKGVVNEGMNLDLSAALSSEMRCFALLFSTQDKAEGLKAFIEKRKPVFQHQ